MGKRRVMFTLYFTVVAAILGLSVISPLLPTLAEDLGASGFMMGMIFSGYAISRAIVMPFMGSLSDKHGRKIFIAPGLALLVVVSLLYPLSHDLGSFIGIRLFMVWLQEWLFLLSWPI